MIELSPDQQIAADKFMEFILDENPGEMVIQGHAGVGKSFMTKHLIDLARKSSGLIKLVTNTNKEINILLTASTNKAAKVLNNMTGEKTRTIHSLLSLKVFNNYKTGETNLQQSKQFTPINNTLIIVDEASMVNKQLLGIIRKSCKECKVLYIMDAYQLAPIKETTCPVADMVENQVVLTTIHRQAKGNPIIDLAEGYRKVLDGGAFPKIIGNGNEIQRVNGEEFKQLVNARFTDVNHTVDSAKILAWRNDTVNQYNRHVRSLYTSSDRFEANEYVIANKPILTLKGAVIHSTDSILKISEVEPEPLAINGVMSWVIRIGNLELYMPINPQDLKKQIGNITRKIRADKKKYGSADWEPYFNMVNRFVDLRPVHASTIHKSQGSTHDIVFINLTDIGQNNKREEVARLMYVAITRAAEKVVLYGKLGTKYGD